MSDFKNAAGSPDKPAFDANQLRERYRIEREKRMRQEGIGQYKEAAGSLAIYAEDIHAIPGFTRDPLSIETTALIIGGGFAGLMAAAQLKKIGIQDTTIVEKGSDFGGTWYWNRYPGAACDTESYIYMPLLEDLQYFPSEKYAKGGEILAHAKAIGRRFDLYKNALFQTEITKLRWDEAKSLWRVTTNRGDGIAARFVVSAVGALHQVKLPGIDGIERFVGNSFHTSRWDYGYTGGDCNGNMSGLADKRVGVIGTGATAVQCVPHLAASAKHLYVFQRTPSTVDERNNRATDLEWTRTLNAGWQRDRQENFNILVSGGHAERDLVNDGWTDLLGKFLVNADPNKLQDKTGLAELRELADLEKMEKVRRRVDSIVRDPATAELLKPYYSLFCKRPCFHDEYLQTFNRQNVTLVDTKGRGVERLIPSGAVVDGVDYPLDCIVYATGFEVSTPYTRRARYEVYGCGGLSLSDKWAQGPRTLHGFHTHGFPNYFVISQFQGGAAANFTHMLDEQARHVAFIIGECRDKHLKLVEADRDAEEQWVNTILELGQRRADYNRTCTPGYYTNEGQITEKSRRDAPYQAGPVAFIALLAAWRDAGGMRGLNTLRAAE